MRINNMHIIIMLIAGIIVSIFSFINNYDLQTFSITILIVCFVFYILGLIIQKILNRIYSQIDTNDKLKRLQEIQEELDRVKALEKEAESDQE